MPQTSPAPCICLHKFSKSMWTNMFRMPSLTISLRTMRKQQKFADPGLATGSASGKRGCNMVFPCPAGAFLCGTSRYKIIIFMRFRRYVRHFLAAFLCLLRPSLPWCFPVRQVRFRAEQVATKSSSSIGFRSYVRHCKIIIFYGFRTLR